jgi:hypothetical protein
VAGTGFKIAEKIQAPISATSNFLECIKRLEIATNSRILGFQVKQIG